MRIILLNPLSYFYFCNIPKHFQEISKITTNLQSELEPWTPFVACPKLQLFPFRVHYQLFMQNKVTGKANMLSSFCHVEDSPL